MDDVQNNIDPYEMPDVVGEIDTTHEEIEFLEKKKKIPVYLWVVMIIVVSLVALILTMNQSPTIQI